MACEHGIRPDWCNKQHSKNNISYRKPSLTQMLNAIELPEEFRVTQPALKITKGRNINWSIIRSKIIKRDGCCKFCKRDAQKTRLVVHHIDGSGAAPGHNESNNDPKNLVTLCNTCHAKFHQLAFKMLGKQYLDNEYINIL